MHSPVDRADAASAQSEASAKVSPGSRSSRTARSARDERRACAIVAAARWPIGPHAQAEPGKNKRTNPASERPTHGSISERTQHELHASTITTNRRTDHRARGGRGDPGRPMGPTYWAGVFLGGFFGAGLLGALLLVAAGAGNRSFNSVEV